MTAAAPTGRHVVTVADRAVALWRTAKHDTLDIAAKLNVPESDVCRAVHGEWEARRCR